MGMLGNEVIMARRSMEDVYFYVALLNDKLASMHKDLEYYVAQQYGHKYLRLVGPNRCVKWERGGYTTGEIYEVVYSMYEMVARF